MARSWRLRSRSVCPNFYFHRRILRAYRDLAWFECSATILQQHRIERTFLISDIAKRLIPRSNILLFSLSFFLLFFVPSDEP